MLFGLVGPGLLSYLTWETAKIRSTQSATGILYVDFFTVVVGEVLAKYLLLATRVPLECSTLDDLRTAPRSGTCAISAYEPRQGRKAAALSRS